MRLTKWLLINISSIISIIAVISCHHQSNLCVFNYFFFALCSCFSVILTRRMLHQIIAQWIIISKPSGKSELTVYCTLCNSIRTLMPWNATLPVKYWHNCFGYKGAESAFNTLNDSFHNNYLIRIRHESKMLCFAVFFISAENAQSQHP